MNPNPNPKRIQLVQEERRKVEKRAERRTLNDYALSREEHVFSDEEIKAVDDWCEKRLYKNGKPNLAVWPLWVAWNLGLRAGLRPFEIAETVRENHKPDMKVLRVYGKRARRTAEEIEKGRPQKPPKIREVIIGKFLSDVLNEWDDIAKQYYPDSIHAVIKGRQPNGQVLIAERIGEGCASVHEMMTDTSLVPKVVGGRWAGYPNWEVIDYSRTFGTSKALYRPMTKMFQELGLHRAHLTPKDAVLTQLCKKGRLANCRHTFSVNTLVYLQNNPYVLPSGMSAVDFVAQQLGHASTDVTITNYIHLSALDGVDGKPSAMDNFK